MDYQVLKNAFLVALITATIVWLIQYFALIEYEELVAGGETIFLAVKAWLVDFAGIFATEAGISLYIGTKSTPATTTSTTVKQEPAPVTAACAITSYQSQ